MISDPSLIADRLDQVRSRTLELLSPLDEAALARTPDPILSPPLWDLGHIAAYEELWLVERLAGRQSRYPGLQATYDAFETPRALRTRVEILDASACYDYLSSVRADVLEILDRADLSGTGDPLLQDGAVFDMVVQHEAQHTETVLQTLQMLPAGDYVPPARRPRPPPRPVGTDPVHLPGGEFAMGAGSQGFRYDCERPEHPRTVMAYLIGRAPVTNGEHLGFIADGGYERPEFWSSEGWIWRTESAASAPLYWELARDGTWLARSFDLIEPVDPHAPLCHVSWFEADAHARWAGARLPTETEWERAARLDGRDGAVFPWGYGDTHTRANLGDRYFAPVSASVYPGGAAPCGALQMIGDVWEWTSTEFDGYPGFSAFPYREYAEVFFRHGYRVLRGGSWATQDVAVRSTFRNWDLPQRRQIFAGFRLAWDNPEEQR